MSGLGLDVEFLRGAFHTSALTNVAQEVSPANGTDHRIYMGGFIAVGGAAAEIIIFQRPSGGAEYFRVDVPIGAVITADDFGFNFVDGLEVLTATAAADVGLTIRFFDGLA